MQLSHLRVLVLFSASSLVSAAVNGHCSGADALDSMICISTSTAAALRARYPGLTTRSTKGECPGTPADILCTQIDFCGPAGTIGNCQWTDQVSFETYMSYLSIF